MLACTKLSLNHTQLEEENTNSNHIWRQFSRLWESQKHSATNLQGNLTPEKYFKFPDYFLPVRFIECSVHSGALTLINLSEFSDLT